MITPLPRYLDAGETALVVEFGSTVDETTNDRVLALDAALGRKPVTGIIERVPTYRSLMVHYDPLLLSRARLIDRIDGALSEPVALEPVLRRRWHLPACYDASFADDLDHVAATVDLPQSEVIRLHSQAEYRVFMYGFAPGFAYLGGLPAALTLPRRVSPRDRIPAGSLIVAGGQALVTTVAMPSGWHILGRTPERLFAPDRDPAFPVAVGDVITFDPIDRATFEVLSVRASSGELVARVEPLS